MPYGLKLSRSRKRSIFERGFTAQILGSGYGIGKVSGPSNDDAKGVREFAQNAVLAAYADDMYDALKLIVENNASNDDYEIVAARELLERITEGRESVEAVISEACAKEVA